MLNIRLDMNLRNSFVGVLLLLLASALLAITPFQFQGIFGQEEIEDETPTFDGQNATFVPSEEERNPPPPPSNATTADELPNESLVQDPDSDPLSITNRTEILEILPANATSIISSLDEKLKNDTGVGLAPSEVIEKITSEEPQGNESIIDLASPEEVQEIQSFSLPLTNVTEDEEEDIPLPAANITEVPAEEVPAEEVPAEEVPAEEVTNVTNATGAEEEQPPAEEEQPPAEEEQPPAEEVTNVTNATGLQVPEELPSVLNNTNITSILNNTELEDENGEPIIE